MQVGEVVGQREMLMERALWIATSRLRLRGREQAGRGTAPCVTVDGERCSE